MNQVMPISDWSALDQSARAALLPRRARQPDPLAEQRPLAHDRLEDARDRLDALPRDVLGQIDRVRADVAQ